MQSQFEVTRLGLKLVTAKLMWPPRHAVPSTDAETNPHGGSWGSQRCPQGWSLCLWYSLTPSTPIAPGPISYFRGRAWW